MHVADIHTAADEDGVDILVKVGALSVMVTLSNRARLELAAGLLRGSAEVAGRLTITPLRVPAGELTEATLNARKVEL